MQYKHKGSVSSGKVLAEEQVPELRMIRKIMEANRQCNVVNAFRTKYNYQ